MSTEETDSSVVMVDSDCLYFQESPDERAHRYKHVYDRSKPMFTDLFGRSCYDEKTPARGDLKITLFGTDVRGHDTVIVQTFVLSEEGFDGRLPTQDQRTTLTCRDGVALLRDGLECYLSRIDDVRLDQIHNTPRPKNIKYRSLGIAAGPDSPGHKSELSIYQPR